MGTVLGEHNVNISRFHLGRRGAREAMAVIEIDAPWARISLGAARIEQVISVRQIDLD